jgi:hypothetical protein
MEKNKGKIDSYIRYGLTDVFIALAIIFDVMSRFAWVSIFIVLAGNMGVTATTRKCPLYLPFKISTVEKEFS